MNSNFVIAYAQISFLNSTILYAYLDGSFPFVIVVSLESQGIWDPDKICFN